MLQELKDMQIVKEDRRLIALSPFRLPRIKTMQLQSETRKSRANTSRKTSAVLQD